MGCAVPTLVDPLYPWPIIATVVGLLALALGWLLTFGGAVLWLRRRHVAAAVMMLVATTGSAIVVVLAPWIAGWAYAVAFQTLLGLRGWYDFTTPTFSVGWGVVMGLTGLSQATLGLALQLTSLRAAAPRSRPR